METIKAHLRAAFTQLGMIAVRGEDVDRMAIARKELRAAFREIEVIEAQNVKNDALDDTLKEAGDGQDH